MLKAQLTKYEGAAFEDRHGTVTYPVVNDVDALHEFTNLSKPVDFAGRIVYNEDGLETINFGKHKGRPIIEVFEQEPSYYAWMQNGDFPLYTKKVLENIWIRYKKEKNEQKAKVATSQSSEEKKLARNEYNRQKEEVPQPISLDMLKELQDKFKK